MAFEAQPVCNTSSMECALLLLSPLGQTVSRKKCFLGFVVRTTGKKLLPLEIPPAIVKIITPAIFMRRFQDRHGIAREAGQMGRGKSCLTRGHLALLFSNVFEVYGVLRTGCVVLSEIIRESGI